MAGRIEVRSPIRFAVRGIGGEVGFTTIVESVLAMRRKTFEAFKGATGGAITAFIRKVDGRDLETNIMGDRVIQKIIYPGSLEANTAPSYGFAQVFVKEGKVLHDPKNPGRKTLVGSDGRLLVIDFVPIPETNIGIPEFGNIDLLYDCTGVGLDPKKLKNPEQDPNLYTQYPNLTVFLSAPCKSVKGIPHHLNGINNLAPAQINATGSCSTHAGVDEAYYIRKVAAQALGVREEDIIIESGTFDTTHSLTPTDNKSLKFYNGAYLPQKTGFGDAAALVWPVPDIQNIVASTGRYFSYYDDGNGVLANGISIFSLTLNIAVPKSKIKLTEEMISNGLKEIAKDPEGRKHIGILNSEAFELDKNKSTGMFTGISLTGFSTTTILPVGKNIEVKALRGVKIIDGKEYDTYAIVVKNSGYDNRAGFAMDALEELNRVSKIRLGGEFIPKFDHSYDIANVLAFVNYRPGQKLFREMLKMTDGNLLSGHRPVNVLLDENLQ
jgi:hypothetical protein